MSNWVRVCGKDEGEIALWCNDNGITYTNRANVINPGTLETEGNWLIPEAKELLIFKLRWSGQ